MTSKKIEFIDKNGKATTKLSESREAKVYDLNVDEAFLYANVGDHINIVGNGHDPVLSVITQKRYAIFEDGHALLVTHMETVEKPEPL